MIKEFRTHKWPLNVSNFTWLDRVKLAKFFLNPSNRWTMGDKVKEFERRMAEFVGVKHAIFTSSGSTANTLIAMWLRNNTTHQNVVVFPSTTWITSVSPFIREGFEPKFIDIQMEDLSMNLDSLDSYLSSHCDSVAAVFITSLVGLTPDMGKIQRIADKYGVRVMMDNCENLFGKYNGSNVSSFFPSTTSTYFGHQLQSVEGGFVFTNDDDMNDSILMLRNHGMIRSLGRDGYKYANQLVDQQFDFFSLGNNFRNSEIHALVGLLDLNRASQYIDTRNKLANEFFTRLDSVKFFVPENNYDGGCEHVMFCLPIIFTNSNIDSIGLSKSYCQLNGIETRPIISGNLLRQTCFKQYDDYTKFPVSEYVHTHGFYVGLHPKVNINELQRLAQVLNFFSVL